TAAAARRRQPARVAADRRLPAARALRDAVRAGGPRPLGRGPGAGGHSATHPPVRVDALDQRRRRLGGRDARVGPTTRDEEGNDMARPVTLFTGQWADLTLDDLAARCAEWGFDGLELACWGDHFDVAQAVSDSSYCAGRRALLERHGLNVWAIGN